MRNINIHAMIAAAFGLTGSAMLNPQGKVVEPRSLKEVSRSKNSRKRIGSDRGIFTKTSQCKYFREALPEINRRITSAREHNDMLDWLRGNGFVSRTGRVMVDRLNADAEKSPAFAKTFPQYLHHHAFSAVIPF